MSKKKVTVEEWNKEFFNDWTKIKKIIPHFVEWTSNPEDPDDDKFFHLALKSGAQYIVSRDVHLLGINEFKGVKVLKPEVFLSALKRRAL